MILKGEYAYEANIIWLRKIARNPSKGGEMSRKFFIASLVIVLISGLILGGCAAPAPTPAPTPAPAPAPTPAPAPAPAPVEPRELIWSSGLPPMTVHQQKLFLPLAQTIKERTTAIGHPVEITFYIGGALGAMPDQYNLLLAGTADIVSQWGPVDMPGRFPLLGVLDLPFLWPSALIYMQVSQELLETRPEIQKEVSEARMLFFEPAPPATVIASRTKPIKTLEDFEGMRTMARGGNNADVIKALGGIPVVMPVVEAYTALERGLLDVAPDNWEALISFRRHEVTKYRTEFPKVLFMTALGCSMNWDTWNSLPPEVQKIFAELSGPEYAQTVGKVLDDEVARNKELVIEYDNKVGNPPTYVLPDEEFERWVEVETPLYDKWIADVEAKGLPGRAIFEDVLRLIEKYSK